MPLLSPVPTANPTEPRAAAGLQAPACPCVSGGTWVAAKPGCRGGCGCWGWPRRPNTQGFSQPYGPSMGHSHPRSSLAGAVPEQGAARQRRGWEPAHAKWLLSVSCCAAQHSPRPHAAPSISPQCLLLPQGPCPSPARCRSSPTLHVTGYLCAGHSPPPASPGDPSNPFPSNSSLLP